MFSGSVYVSVQKFLIDFAGRTDDAEFLTLGAVLLPEQLQSFVISLSLYCGFLIFRTSRNRAASPDETANIFSPCQQLLSPVGLVKRANGSSRVLIMLFDAR